MAAITVTDTAVRLDLTLTEVLGCGIRTLEIPRDQIIEAQVVDRPFTALRGLRAPGIGLPKTVAIGRWRHRGGTDLLILRRDDRAIQLDLGPAARFRRVVVGTPTPEELHHQLAEVSA